MSSRSFERQIEYTTQRLEELQKRAEASQPSSLLNEVLEELFTALEELHVAGEEMRQQNEALESARLEIDKERRRYQDLFDFAPDGYVVTDLQGIIQEANRATAVLLCVEPLYLIKKPLLLYVRKKDQLTFQAQLALLKDRRIREIRDWEIWLQDRKTGRADKLADPFPAAVSVSLVCDSQDKPIALRWLIRDISERKQAEEALRRAHDELEIRVAERTAELARNNELLRRQERLAAVGQLAAGIAHDFNNIMASILLYVELAQRSPDLSRANEQRLATIYHQTERASYLVRQILDFSRQSVMTRQPVALRPFLQELQDLLKNILPKNIDLDLVYEEVDGVSEDVKRIPAYLINGDENHLQQVIMNLALNARDALPEDGGSIHFHLSYLDLKPGQAALMPEMAPGRWVCLKVIDSGTGISSDILPHVFDPFFTTKPPGQGTGLGLAQVYGIVKQHDGHILLESQGDGTTVTICLPALAAPAMADDPEPELPSLPRTNQRGRILLIERDETLRQALVDTLETWNYQVLAAGSGQKALEICIEDTQRFDLILSDMDLPDISGIELFHLLKKGWPKLIMIIISDYGLPDEGLALQQQGVIAWLKKPFKPHEIAEQVQAALDNR